MGAGFGITFMDGTRDPGNSHRKALRSGISDSKKKIWNELNFDAYNFTKLVLIKPITFYLKLPNFFQLSYIKISFVTSTWPCTEFFQP